MDTDSHLLSYPDSFVDWLKHRNEPASLKSVASLAIDAFRVLIDDSPGCDRSLELLYSSACHDRLVVWEVALPLLARLAETNSAALTKVVGLSRERNAELRRRSIQYLTDRYPRMICASMLTHLITDRSVKVKGLAATQIASLSLIETLFSLESALATESNATVRWSYIHTLALMRDGFHYDKRQNTATLWLYYPELYPARTIAIGDALVRFENGDDILQIKSDFLQSFPYTEYCRRNWEWGDDPNDVPQFQNETL